MRQIICDRCGKEINYSQGKPVFAITRTNTSQIMDMCKECRRDLIVFMHGGRVIDVDCIEKGEADNDRAT